LIDMLTRQGIDYGEAYVVSKTVSKNYDLRKLRPGDTLQLVLLPDLEHDPEEGVTPMKLKRLTMSISKTEMLTVTPTEEGAYQASKKDKELTKESRRISGTIDGSLYLTAAEQGVPDRVIVQLIKNFSYDVDFQREIRAGDTLDVMFETKKTAKDGKLVEARVLYAKLNSGGDTFEHFRYEDAHGRVGYYDKTGESIVNKLLRTPVNGARISSRFGRRHHPVLGYTKMHKGVDFAAPTGTPIYAAGDGRVEFAGRNGGYGNMVVLRHNGMYKTAYAHAHRIARGIRKGARVEQGQTIAYVGTTGRSTGPHLHYEIRKYGKKINPLSVKFAGGKKLKGKQLAAFKEQRQVIETRLAELQPEATQEASVALAQ
jgi:murein DD-endopeptidase MepM/ murein hydrolase activator NlpD